ncbi:UNVERIFIED_CONTAM: hypothetical protein GTU68_065779 [Idotea baltica]|nr:hypothetical protein [Idotea baltica]
MIGKLLTLITSSKLTSFLTLLKR